MNLKYKPDLEQAKKYWRAYWQREVIDRPVVVVRSPKKGEQWDTRPINAPRNWKLDQEGRLKEVFEDFDQVASKTFYGGEAIPFFDINFGPDQFAAMFGGEIVAADDVGTTWVHPTVDDLYGYTPSIDRSPNGVFAKLKKFYELGAEMSEGKYILGTLDYHSHLDALSAMRGAQNLCYDFMDCEDEVVRVRNELSAYYPEIFEAMRSAGKMETRGSIAWIPAYLEEGRFAVTQCDFSCLLSPDQARRIMIPALREEAEYLDHTVYHYDGKEALGHLDYVLDIEEIDVIQWVPGAGNPRSIEWMDLLHHIQSRNKGLWIFDWTPEEIKAHFKELRPEGLAFEVCVGSEEEAEDLLEYLKRHM